MDIYIISGTEITRMDYPDRLGLSKKTVPNLSYLYPEPRKMPLAKNIVLGLWEEKNEIPLKLLSWRIGELCEIANLKTVITDMNGKLGYGG